MGKTLAGLAIIALIVVVYLVQCAIENKPPSALEQLFTFFFVMRVLRKMESQDA